MPFVKRPTGTLPACREMGPRRYVAGVGATAIHAHGKMRSAGCAANYIRTFSSAAFILACRASFG